MSNQNQQITLEEYLQKIEQALPPNYYVQHIPDFNTSLNYFPEFKQEQLEYNHGALMKNGLRDGNRVLMLNLLLQIAAKGSKGDYAELGTYEGNTARLIWKNLPKGSRLYCFDTFEGFDSRDVDIEKKETGLGVQVGQFTGTPVEQITKTICGKPSNNRLILKEGYFPDTFSGLENVKWRFVHLDCDLYEPTRNGLEKFWPNMVGGGVLAIHDYNNVFTGVKKAVDEFFAPLGITPVPCNDKAGTGIVIKCSDASNAVSQG